MMLPLAILKAAALLVPGGQRAEWLAEWRTELWYVKRRRALFCLGAFGDACWIRRNRSAPLRLRLESPVSCLLSLAILAAGSLFLAFRLPLPRAIFLPSPYRAAREMALISAEHSDPRTPTVTFEQYRSLALHPPYRFQNLAFYRPGKSTGLSVAIASDNLFDLLGIQIAPAAASVSRLVLSRSAWRKYFAGDAHIAGRVLEIAGQRAVVAGVIPESFWSLPGKIDAWLLQDDVRGNVVPRTARVFVLGRLRASVSQPDGQWRLAAGGQDFKCSPVVQGNLVVAFLLMMLLSLLLLRATTSMSLGEYPPSGHSAAKRRLFFGLKIAILLPVVYFGTLDLAAILSPGIQAHGFLIGTVLALRWALVDQRRRCPVCLRLLGSPTRIGGPSHIFLDWYGTGLMCIQGHGLLYVPEISTSCYSTQRWQNLDSTRSTKLTFPLV